ncbi:hypothetical protein [Flagellimonas profundi]|uniref:Uncharacterized protein n=1 Tax=Flagellimonas profundi TaxID=2915620 RepID=A0ABS3FC03_9FLAO|nr:hypothetical protein [Allomuricauda profundi]MBO0340695.1 hypothetical protein [Allomuricauda profundi]MBV35812.1 hypothetical protein [Rickettsiales bacterium]
MDTLSIAILIIPTIVLLLVVFAYVHFKGKVTDVKEYRRYVLNIAFTAFTVNLLWEIAHGTLYEGFEYDLKHIAFCTLASVADMLMVLLLFFGFAIVYKDLFWIGRLNTQRLVLLIAVGTIGAILAEIWHTGRGDWAYAANMPLLPFVKVGVSPVVQFALLPWLIFSAVVKKMKKS